MKPALTMDGKTAAVDIPTVQQAEPARARSKRSLIIVVSIIALVSVLVVVGVTFGAFYAGMNAGKDSYKEAWMTFHTGEDDETVIKERVVVRENEAEFIRPGVMKMVVDYEQELLVMQYDRELQGDEQLYCYVYDYEPGMFGTARKEEIAISGEQHNMTVPLESDAFRFESTGETVPISELSPAARRMCFGANILRVHRTEQEDEERSRREVVVGDERDAINDDRRVIAGDGERAAADGENRVIVGGNGGDDALIHVDVTIIICCPCRCIIVIIIIYV